LTSPKDKIWTSEGVIAFFARPGIDTPNSTDWPAQTCYNDVFNEVSINMFIEGWKKENVTVIILITGAGWVPYPDSILLNGTRNEGGANTYLSENYELNHVFTLSSPLYPSTWGETRFDVPYSYNIWVKK
jgi:hypothetical protein